MLIVQSYKDTKNLKCLGFRFSNNKKIPPHKPYGSWGGCGLYQVTDEKINCA
jgi:hypothetical protein